MALSPKDILDEVQANFTAGQRRKFLPGLLIALIHFLRKLDVTEIHGLRPELGLRVFTEAALAPAP